MDGVMIGGNAYYGVPFPVAIGNRYIHVRQEVDGTMAVQVLRWHPETRTVTEEAVSEGTSPASPISVLPDSELGGVRVVFRGQALEGYAVGGAADAITVVFHKEGTRVLRGDEVVFEMLRSIFADSPVGLRVYENGDVDMGSGLPDGFEVGRQWREQAVLLPNLVTPRLPVLSHAQFTRCRIDGPTVVFSLGNVDMEACTFETGGARPEWLVWELSDEEHQPYGAVFLDDVKFWGCYFVGVALGCRPGRRQEVLRQMFGSFG